MCKALEDIRLEGIEEGISQGIQALTETCQEFGWTKERTLEKVMEKFSLSREKAEKYMRQYWKL